MTIKDVENILQVERANIRYYEKEGLLITRRNPMNGYRDYSEGNVEQLKRIIFLRNLGISIVEIRNLQSGNESLKSVIIKHKENLKEQTEKLKIAKDICNELLKIEDITFETLNIANYSFCEERDKKILLKDTITYLFALKDVFVPWMLITISLITAFVSFPLLPEKVATDWYGLEVIAVTKRIVIFLFPVVMVGITVFAKAMISNILYFRMPHFLLFVDEIAGYFSICAALIIYTYQMYIVLFLGGFKIGFYSIMLTEIFASVGFVIIILLLKRKRRPANNV